MKYDLAKQLKDAGFPQLLGGWAYNGGKLIYTGSQTIKTDDYIHVPTLEELIEACRNRFKRLVYDPAQIGYEDVEWIACATGEEHIEGHGNTPSKAVANLWLELNAD